MKKYMNINQLSEFLNINVSTLYSYVHRKTIPFIKIGGRVLFDEKQIEAFIEGNTFLPY